MTSRDFCYWLQGLFELGNPQQLTPQQTEMVKRHLALVFRNETATPEPQVPVRSTDPRAMRGVSTLIEALQTTGSVAGAAAGVAIC